jgi:hypothetical protein
VQPPGPFPDVFVYACHAAADALAEEPKPVTVGGKTYQPPADGLFTPGQNGRGILFLRALSDAMQVIVEAPIDVRDDPSHFWDWHAGYKILRVVPTGRATGNDFLEYKQGTYGQVTPLWTQ